MPVSHFPVSVCSDVRSLSVTLRANLADQRHIHGGTMSVSSRPVRRESIYRVAFKDLLMACEKCGDMFGKSSTLSMGAQLQGFKLRRAYRSAAWIRDCGRAILLLPLALLGCSSVALPQTEAPATEPNTAEFHKIIGDYLKASFKDIGTYDSFEISDAKWVHTPKGWRWLNCIRFQDRGHIRTYAVFIQTDHVVDSRYAVTTDGCSEQTFVPFDAIPMTAKPSGGMELDPLH